MIINDEKLVVYLNSLVNNVFKILPLYEEKNIGIVAYVESLYGEVSNLDEVIEVKHSSEYISLLASLKTIRNEVEEDDSKKSTVKREVFKCINIIKNMVGKLEGE